MSSRELVKTLITGATGALGQSVLKYLKNHTNYQVTATGRTSSAINGIIQCDVSSKSQLESCLKQAEPDLILHLAASFSSDLDEAYQMNVGSTKHILDIIKLHKYNTRVVLIGSAAEYGVVQKNENPISEEHVLSPVSAYGVSKAWQTQLMGMYSSTGLDIVCARIFNLYGAGVSERLFAGRLQNQIKEVLVGKREIIELGSLEAIRDYISTDEAAKQLLAIATKGLSGKVYNIASGTPISMRDFMCKQLATNKLDPSIVREAKSFSNHSGYDVPVIYADISRTLQLLEK